MEQVVNVEKTIRECIEILKFKADMKKIEMHVTVPP
jgi:hypothetical protein